MDTQQIRTTESSAWEVYEPVFKGYAIPFTSPRTQDVSLNGADFLSCTFYFQKSAMFLPRCENELNICRVLPTSQVI